MRIFLKFQTQSYGYGSNNGAPPTIKYVPLPHHDLPVLIYTSDSQPPIHVVHTPKPNLKTSYPNYKRKREAMARSDGPQAYGPPALYHIPEKHPPEPFAYQYGVTDTYSSAQSESPESLQNIPAFLPYEAK